VIVGGWDQTEITIQEVEIIDLETLQVRNATDFPRPISRHEHLYVDDTFMIMGGRGCDGCTSNSCSGCGNKDLIYRYNKVDDTWITLSEKLPFQVDRFSAMYVENLC